MKTSWLQKSAGALRWVGVSVGLLLTLGAAAPARAAESIPLTIRAVGSPSDARVFTGIPFPPQACSGPEQVALVYRGQSVPRSAEALSRYPDGSVRVVLLGFQAPLADLAAGRVTAGVRYDGAVPPVDASIPWTRNPALLALCEPRWYGESGVFNLPFLASGDNTLFPAFENRLREKYTAHVDPPSNNDPEVRDYYDRPHALYMTLLRTGGPDSVVRRIAEAVEIYREQQILHSGPFRGQWRGGTRLQNTYPMLLDTIRRQYPQGLLEDYYFTGDRRSLEVALEIGDALLKDAYLDVERYYCQERMAGFTIMGLCAVYEATLDRRYLDGARYLAGEMLDLQAAMAAKFPNQGGVSGQTGGFIQDIYGKWFDPSESSAAGAGSPWMTALLGEGLIRLYWLTADPRLHESILEAADWMVDAGFAPAAHPRNSARRDGFWYVCGDLKDKVVFPGLNPMHLQMLGFAHQATGDPKYRTTAERILAVNSWGASIKEYNQGMHSSGQGLYLLQFAPGSLPLTQTAPGGARDIAAPDAPAGVSPAPGDAGVTLTWEAGRETDLTGYRVYRAVGDGPLTLAAALPAGQVQFTDGGLANGTTYRYLVTATDAVGNESAPSGIVSTVPSAASVRTFAVSGRVTMRGYGLAGTLVQIGGRSALTGSDGGYVVRGLPAGAYRVEAVKPGNAFTSAPVTVGPADGRADLATVNPWIFRETLPAGWKIGTKNAKLTLTPDFVGEEYLSMALTIAGKNGYAQLSGPGISLSGRQALRFFVHGGRGGQRLQVQALVDGQARRTVNLEKFGGPIRGGWTEYRIPLAELDATAGELTGVKLLGPAAQKTVYLDVLQVE